MLLGHIETFVLTKILDFVRFMFYLGFVKYHGLSFLFEFFDSPPQPPSLCFFLSFDFVLLVCLYVKDFSDLPLYNFNVLTSRIPSI